MQNFITDHEGENVSSILKIVDIYTDSEEEDLSLDNDNCVWVIDSIYNGKHLPRMRQHFQGYKIPTRTGWDFMDETGLTIPNGSVDIETRLVIRSVRHNLADNYQIAVKELQEFHQKRIQRVDEQIQHLTSLKEQELKKFSEFSTEWVH